MNKHPDTNPHPTGPSLAGLLLAALLSTSLWSPPAGALQFWPTEAEWLTWPEFCRARYVESGAGRESSYVAKVDPGLVRAWQSKLGAAWVPLHHHCAALALAERARLSKDPEERRRLLERVIGENQYTLARIPETHPMNAEVATRIGLAHRELGNVDAALEYLDMAIGRCPACAAGYQGKALIFRDQKQYAKARDVLVAGNEATGGESPEIHYFLGLVLVDLKDYERAREHAARAYELGYPLPGLRDKLARAGHPLQ
jgi:tetratricopeptide (TPR) repeat protein